MVVSDQIHYLFISFTRKCDFTKLRTRKHKENTSKQHNTYIQRGIHKETIHNTKPCNNTVEVLTSHEETCDCITGVTMTTSEDFIGQLHKPHEDN